MNYSEAINYIHSVSWLGSKPGLSRTKALLERLGNPEKELKFVHVVGTNGKGSTSLMLSNILKEAGYKVGLYVSPYVLCFNERIQLNGEMISDDDLAEVTEKIKKAAEKLDDKPTEFELVTAIGFEYFKRKKADIVILEAGMGGEFDSTNVIPSPLLVIVTEIGLDHTGVLGNTVREIAKTKSGVIKEGTTVLSFNTLPEVKAVILEACSKKSVPMYEPDFNSVVLHKADISGLNVDIGKYKNITISLSGKYQLRNAAAVVKAAEIMKSNFNISDKNIIDGLKTAVWRGRFEKLSDSPFIISDGGHNPQGIRAAVDSFKMHFPGEKPFLVLGTMADKDVKQIVDICGEIAEKVFTVMPDNPRAMKSDDLAELCRSKGIPAVSCGDVSNGLKEAIEESTGERKIFALGSLYMYSQVYSYVKSLSK